MCALGPQQSVPSELIAIQRLNATATSTQLVSEAKRVGTSSLAGFAECCCPVWDCRPKSTDCRPIGYPRRLLRPHGFFTQFVAVPT